MPGLIVGGLLAALTLCMSLGFAWLVIRRLLNQLQDAGDRLAEMIGQVHAYQVDANRGQLSSLHQPAAFHPTGGAPGASGEAVTSSQPLHVSEWEDDAYAMAKRADGTIDHAMVQRLLAESAFDNQEIPLT